MTLTYASFLLMLQAALSTVEGAGTYSDDLYYYATCGAIGAIMPWAPKRSVVTITADGSSEIFALPEDCYQVEAVQDVTSGTFMDRVILAAGKTRNNETASARVTGFDWLEYPAGSLYLSRKLANESQFRVYYQSNYATPDSKSHTQFVFETPMAATAGMVYWAAAHCLVPPAIASAQIRQFNTRVDSGNPVDNSLEMEARFLRALFLEEMARLPKSLGAVK